MNRKKLEDNDHALISLLKASETRYRRLFESAKDGILILDFETGCIVDVNPYLESLLQYKAELIIGKQLWEIGLFSNKQESEQAFEELKKTGYIRFDDMPLRNAHGKSIDVEFISNVYLVDTIKVIQCNIRDISERKKIDRAFKASKQILKNKITEYKELNTKYSLLNDELTASLHRIKKINEELLTAKSKAEESDRLKTAFLANLSHEIRTPLNAIMGFSDLLVDTSISKSKMISFANIINTNSAQLLSVIGDLIDISQLETGQIVVKSEVVDVNNLFHELLSTYQLVINNRIHLKCSTRNPNNPIIIISDGNRIKQILCNLLNNALKFCTEGEIEFGYKIKPDLILIFVKDTGIGISKENHKLIFDRFRQVEKPTTKIYGGNGLGLSISAALVAKLGGVMSIHSELGKGSTFSFTIPLNPQSGNSDEIKN